MTSCVGFLVFWLLSGGLGGWVAVNTAPLPSEGFATHYAGDCRALETVHVPVMLVN